MGPFKCLDCGVWWAGFEHRCREIIPSAQTNAPLVIRPYVPPFPPPVSTTSASAPWCAICAGWHIPGAGPCTATYSVGNA